MAESWRVALASVRANGMAMAALWCAAIAVVVAYYLSPSFAAALEPLKAWQTECGVVAAALNRIAFCGLLPGVFLCSVKSIRPPRPALTIIAYCSWAAMWGVLCDWFYTLQMAVFGARHDILTIVAKTAVDQIVWTAVLCTPFNAVFFAWVAADFRRVDVVSTVRRGYWPMLFANWIVWSPVAAVVYMFPLVLQIQLVGLAGAFWMLAALRAGARVHNEIAVCR